MMIFCGRVRQGPKRASSTATRAAFTDDAGAARTFFSPARPFPSTSSSVVAGTATLSALAAFPTSRMRFSRRTPRLSPCGVRSMHQAWERSAPASVPGVAGAGPGAPVPWAAAADWKSIEPAAATPAFLNSDLRVVSMAILRRGREVACGPGRSPVEDA